MTTPPEPKLLPSGIELEVCKDIAARQAKGEAKYGVTVADNPLTQEQWLQHAYEEALDLAVYLKRINTRHTQLPNIKALVEEIDNLVEQYNGNVPEARLELEQIINRHLK